jgi:hypothetical protein
VPGMGYRRVPYGGEGVRSGYADITLDVLDHYFYVIYVGVS